MNILLCKVLVFNNTGVGHKDTTSSFAPFNTLLGHEVNKILPKTNVQERQGLIISRKDEINMLWSQQSQVGQDASARLIHDDESVEGVYKQYLWKKWQYSKDTVSWIKQIIKIWTK